MMAKLLELKEEMLRRMHWPIPEQGDWLRQVVGGFFNYHPVPTNSRALAAFRYHVTVLWDRTLRRRRQRDRTTWDRIAQLAEEWLPKPRIVGVPFGAHARLILLYLQTEALRTGNREVELA
jgi:RNA-directed DNA polymerase